MPENRSMIKSFNDAFTGLLYGIRTERNFKLHLIFAFIVLLISLFLNLTKVEFLILFISIMFVLISEIVNTSIENIVDLITESYHPLAQMAKDLAAGAVLLASINAVLVGYVLIVSKIFKINRNIEFVIDKILQKPEYIFFMSLAMIFFIVVITKVITHKGTPFRGGIPSGHSAFAFSVVGLTLFITKDVFLVLIVSILAGLLALSRIKDKIHNLWEVIAGAALGFFISMLFFSIYWRLR